MRCSTLNIHKISILALLLLVGGLYSCKPQLDLKSDVDVPDGEALKDTNDLQSAIDAAYSAMSSQYALGGAFKIWPDVITDYLEQNPAKILQDEDEIYWRRMTADNKLIEQNWTMSYRAINRANQIIHAIESGEIEGVGNGTTVRWILGEAYQIRAIMHFELVRLYALPYDESTLSSPGIILRTSHTTNLDPTPRSTVEQVHNQVINDFKKAKELLADVPIKSVLSYDDPGTVLRRASAVSAAAYLSRVYFQMGRNDDALTEINFSIGPGSVGAQVFNTVPFGNISGINPFGAFSSTAFRADVLFMLINQTSISDQSTFIRDRFRKRISILGGESPDPDPNYYLIYSRAIQANALTGTQLTSDTRFTGNFNGVRSYYAVYPDDSRRVVNKYSQNVFNIPVIRIQELLLTRAEIYEQKGNLASAKADLDKVRLVYALGALPNTNNLLVNIRKERNLELIGEGDRLHELRRRREDIPPGSRPDTDPLPWNSQVLVWPIPALEIAANSACTQNPGY